MVPPNSLQGIKTLIATQSEGKSPLTKKASFFVPAFAFLKNVLISK